MFRITFLAVGVVLLVRAFVIFGGPEMDAPHTVAALACFAFGLLFSVGSVCGPAKLLD